MTVIESTRLESQAGTEDPDRVETDRAAEARSELVRLLAHAYLGMPLFA
jgi:hypothetical protein